MGGVLVRSCCQSLPDQQFGRLTQENKNCSLDETIVLLRAHDDYIMKPVSMIT